MISSSTNLPIIMIFEQHWDTMPKHVIQELIPALSEEGYNTFCFETSKVLTEKEILSRHNWQLKEDNDLYQTAIDFLAQRNITNINLFDMHWVQLNNLMKNFVSSQFFEKVSEKIKQLPASRLLQDIFKSCIKNSYSLQGVDITDFSTVVSDDLSKRRHIHQEKETYRINTMIESLIELKNQGKGIIFLCGESHSVNLINKIRENHLSDRTLYYFPFSPKSFEKSFGIGYDHNESMKDHTFILNVKRDWQSLANKIIREVKEKNTVYIKEIIKNSHSMLLSQFFNKEFRAFSRPGNYVDALLKIDHEDNVTEIINKLKEVNISTHTILLENSEYLVISEINTKKVADQIRLLK